VPHAYLHDRIISYLTLIDQELEEVPFDRLYIEGVRLQNALLTVEQKVLESELPSLGAPTSEALVSMLQIHGTFMMATVVGMELIGAEERYQRAPQEERALRQNAYTFAQNLQGRPDIIAPHAADFVLKAAEEIGAGQNVERSTVAATSTMKNATIVIVSGATLGAFPVVGAALAGSAGLVGGGLVALVGVEGLKRSKSFLSVAGIVTRGLDSLNESEANELLNARARTFAPYVRFVLKIAPTLRRLAEGDQFKWLAASLNWLEKQSTVKKDEESD
jgi:hypothetical protein